MNIDNELFCDDEGVPLLIQSMLYLSYGMWFEVVFFDGHIKRFTTDLVCPEVDLMQNTATKMQYYEAENNINKLAVKYWSEWFPYVD